MVHPRDGTNTSLGIAKARGMFRKKGRKNVPWVCIVITDGNSKEPAKTANESLVTRNDGNTPNQYYYTRGNTFANCYQTRGITHLSFVIKHVVIHICQPL